MSGTSWLSSLPDMPGTARDSLVLSAVSGQLAYCNWISVTSTVGENTAIFQVCDDAVKVDLDDGSRFRPQVTALLAQKCADAMGASFVTSKIMDLSYKQAAVVLNAVPLGAGSDMVTTTRSKTYNQNVEKKRAGRTGLVRDVGKAWILDNALAGSAGAINYGFYDLNAPSVGPGGCKMWQTIGTRHNGYHTDYSQTLFVMQKTCQLNGQAVDVSNIMTDPQYATLINYAGVLHYQRQPGV